jgi:hypothetical protein
MTTKPKHARQRLSKAALDGLVYALQAVIADVIHLLPTKQQIQVLDGLLQAIVQRLNWLNDREKGK